MHKLKTLLPILLVVLLCYAEARRSKRVYTVEIDESGTRFNETVEVNERENTVIYKVPDHNNVDQSEVLFDYKKGYFATRIPKLKECFIQRIPKDQSSPEQVRESLQLQRKMMKGRKKEEIPVKTIVAEIVKERKIKPSELSTRFLTFCGDYDAYEVKDISQQVLDFKGNETNEKIREKRSDTKFGGWLRDKSNPDKWNYLTLNTCEKLTSYQPSLLANGCAFKPDKWEYRCGPKSSTCMYYFKCKLRIIQHYPLIKKILCVEVHYFTGWTCCKIVCR